MDKWLENRELPYHLLSACGLVRRDGLVLLVRNPRRGWELPGGTVEQGEASAEIVDGKVNLSIPQGATGDVEIPQSLQPLLDDKADAVQGVTDLKAYIDNLIGGGTT